MSVPGHRFGKSPPAGPGRLCIRDSPAPLKPAPASARVSPRVQARRRLLGVWAVTAVVLAGAVTLGTVRTGTEPKTDFWATLKSQLQPLPARDARVNAPPPAAVDLSSEVRRIVAANPDYRIGVVVQDTRGGEPQTYGDTADYTAASTAKILTAVAYYALVERGERSWTRSWAASTPDSRSRPWSTPAATTPGCC